MIDTWLLSPILRSRQTNDGRPEISSCQCSHTPCFPHHISPCIFLCLHFLFLWFIPSDLASFLLHFSFSFILSTHQEIAGLRGWCLLWTNHFSWPENIVRAYGDVHVSPGICSWPAVSGGRVTGQGSRGQLNHKVAACLLLYLRIVSITDITVEIDAAVSRFITDQWRQLHVTSDTGCWRQGRRGCNGITAVTDRVSHLKLQNKSNEVKSK